MGEPLCTLRPIRPEDDAAVGAIIRAVMPEFGADGPGFALHDPEVGFMSRAYSAPRSRYFVVERDGRVLGGAGVAQLEGATQDVCELRKMYFLKELRGLGLGEKLLKECLAAARVFKYKTMYLETLTGMDAAQKLYEKLGFKRLKERMGATGHSGCNRYYAIEL